MLPLANAVNSRHNTTVVTENLQTVDWSVTRGYAGTQGRTTAASVRSNPVLTAVAGIAGIVVRPTRTRASVREQPRSVLWVLAMMRPRAGDGVGTVLGLLRGWRRHLDCRGGWRSSLQSHSTADSGGWRTVIHRLAIEYTLPRHGLLENCPEFEHPFWRVLATRKMADLETLWVVDLKPGKGEVMV